MAKKIIFFEMLPWVINVLLFCVSISEISYMIHQMSGGKTSKSLFILLQILQKVKTLMHFMGFSDILKSDCASAGADSIKHCPADGIHRIFKQQR